MTNRVGIIIVAISLSFLFTASMSKLVLCVWRELFNYELSSAIQWEQIDNWLDESELGQYKQLYREKGEYFTCYLSSLISYFFFLGKQFTRIDFPLLCHKIFT